MSVDTLPRVDAKDVEPFTRPLDGFIRNLDTLSADNNADLREYLHNLHTSKIGPDPVTPLRYFSTSDLEMLHKIVEVYDSSLPIDMPDDEALREADMTDTLKGLTEEIFLERDDASSNKASFHTVKSVQELTIEALKNTWTAANTNGRRRGFGGS